MLRTTIARFVSVGLSVGFSAGAMACSSTDSTLAGGTDGGAAASVCPAENPNCREAATVQAGETAVGRRKCNTCHDSPKGKMSGSANLSTAAGIELYAPNLTPDDQTGIGTWGDDQLASAIRAGLDREGQQLCPQMQHFPTMSDFEAFSIIKYLRTLPKVSNKVLRSVCPPLKSKSEQR